MRRSYLAAAAGVIVLALAVVLNLVVVPSQLRLPANTDKTRLGAGTASVIIDPAALASGNVSGALLRDATLRVSWRVQVVRTHANTALVRDTRTLATTSGRQLASVSQLYSVDRTTLTGAPWTGGGATGYVVPSGITVNFPFQAGKHDYTGYVADTGGTVTEHYTGTAVRNGLTTYVYTVHVPPALERDPAVLAQLPAAAPRTLLAGLAPALGLTPTQLAGLSGAVAQLPDPVPLRYLYAEDATYYVDPLTGLVVDLARTETRTVALPQPGGALLPVAPVYHVTLRLTPAAVTSVVNEAKDAHRTVLYLADVLPAILTLIGLTLLASAVLTERRRRRLPPGDISGTGPAAGTPAEPAPLSPAGRPTSAG